MRAHIGVDAARWTAALDRLPAEYQDVYFRPEFHQVHAANGDGAPHCSIVEDGASLLLVPGLSRAVRAEGAAVERWDLQTCRTGCAGPLTNAGDDREFLERAWSLWIDEMARHGAVAALFRLHPLLRNERWLPERASVVADRPVVFVDLRQGRAETWRRSESRHRNMVRKAQRLGGSVAWNEGHGEFVDLYRESMDRLHADPELRFTPGFFEALWTLPSVELATMRQDGVLSAAALFLFGRRWAHYYLSARRPDASNHATSQLIDAALDRAAERGLEGLYLGGGRTTAPDDELLRFKRSTGGELLSYQLALARIDGSEFDRLMESWADDVGARPTWLLGYRQPRPGTMGRQKDIRS